MTARQRGNNFSEYRQFIKTLPEDCAQLFSGRLQTPNNKGVASVEVAIYAAQSFERTDRSFSLRYNNESALIDKLTVRETYKTHRGVFGRKIVEPFPHTKDVAEAIALYEDMEKNPKVYFKRRLNDPAFRNKFGNLFYDTEMSVDLLIRDLEIQQKLHSFRVPIEFGFATLLKQFF